ncbi:hypothetical protein FACS1894132_03140 [Clostridia bacterium]|nr:hypothetical protein FACS1894132_03140 [Clostridia bacterium]
MGNIVSFPELGWEFDVQKIAFTIFGVQIAWYGVIISVAMAISIIYAFSHSDRFNLDNDKMLDAVIGGIIGGVIGARLYYVIMKHEDYKTFKDIINIREGGLAVYGGIIGAFLTAYVICRIKKLSFLKLFDLAGICLCIGQAIGRWGNFFNQEAFGTNTKLPWGMTSQEVQGYILSITNDGKLANGKELLWDVPVHPCFLYESIWCVLGFVFLAWYSKRRKFDGQIFLMYIGWYGLGRFFIEGLRTDSLYIGNIRASQLVAALCVIVSATLLVILSKKSTANKTAFATNTAKIVSEFDDNSGETEDIIQDEFLNEPVKKAQEVANAISNFERKTIEEIENGDSN